MSSLLTPDILSNCHSKNLDLTHSHGYTPTNSNIEYQAIKLFTFIVNYYQIPSTVTNYLHNNINQLLKELSVKGTKKSLSLVSVSDSEYFEIISILSYDNTHRITNCSFSIE